MIEPRPARPRQAAGPGRAAARRRDARRARCRRCWPRREQLAATVAMGVHGRRRAGHGRELLAVPPGACRRRRARGRLAAVGQVRPAVHPRDGMGGGADGALWVDDAPSMELPAIRARARPSASARAAGAGAVGAADHGRRAGGADRDRCGAAARRAGAARCGWRWRWPEPRGRGRLRRAAEATRARCRGARAVFFSDFLGDLERGRGGAGARPPTGRARAASCRCSTRPRRPFPSTAG